jgi:hypothetical protein
MNRFNNQSTITQIYTYVWSKYRPAILKLMVDSADGPQQYKFSDHEFRSINPREKKGYAFTLLFFEGKAVNPIRTSPPAQDLLLILQQSKRALELSGISTYQFVLDKRFTLHVTRQEKEQTIISENISASELILKE